MERAIDFVDATALGHSPIGTLKRAMDFVDLTAFMRGCVSFILDWSLGRSTSHLSCMFGSDLRALWLWLSSYCDCDL